MNKINIPEIKELLFRLGYHEANISDISDELIILFNEIDLDKVTRLTNSAIKKKDTAKLIDILKDIMLFLEIKGIYRPDIPSRLSRLLVNGLNYKNEDIFGVLKKNDIPKEIRKKEEELLVSCAVITQLGYILLSCLELDVKAASAGPHVFLLMDGFSRDQKIFIDFSQDSIHEIDIDKTYYRIDEFYYLKDKDDLSKLDSEVSGILSEFFSFFHTTSGFGLSHNIYNNLGIVYDTAGRYNEAIVQIKEALKLDPKYIEAHNNLAVVYYKLGMYEDTIKELRVGLSLYPKYSRTLSNLGIVYSKLKKYEEAITYIQEAIQNDPGYAPAHNTLGTIYAGQKRNHEAMQEYQEAIKIKPDYSLAHNNLGYFFFESDKYEDAVKEFEESIRLDPYCIEAHHGIGLALYEMGSYDRAAHAWARAVHLKPGLLDSVPDIIKLKVSLSLSKIKFSD